jgi:Tfp pilus assembly protein PilF
MQRNAVWLAAMTLAGVVVFLAGCQFPSFRSAKRASPDDHDRPLNDRQVADVQLSLARSLEQRGEIEPALKAYRQAAEKDPRRAIAHWRMAVLLDRQGKSTESEPLYRQALKLESKNPDLLCDFGYSLSLQRRWAEAEEHLRQAIALKPKHPRAHNNLGLVLAHTEQTAEALVEFRKAGCNESDAHNNLAFSLLLNRRWEDARKHYELALDANPDSVAAKSGLEKLNSLVAKLDAAPSPSTDIALTSYERPAKDAPAKKKRAQSPAVPHDEAGHAEVSTTSRDD